MILFLQISIILISMNLSISVIIPNYNRAKLVGITIENMLSQTLKPTEIIVVDDGSTDNSVEVIRSFGSKVTLVCQNNQGPGAARNVGLNIATGDYIQFLDSDDLCSLNKLECQAKSLQASASDIAYSPWAKVHIESQKVRFENHVLQQKPLPHSANPLSWFLRGWFIIFQACLFRHSFLKKVGVYRADLITAEDSEFLIRILLQQPKLQFVPDGFLLYRLHEMGQLTASGTTQNNRFQDWHKFLQLADFQLRVSQAKVDILTWLIFQAKRYQALEYLRNVPDVSPDVINKCDLHYSVFLKKIYGMLNLYKRIETGLRGRVTGSRYSHFYQAFYPNRYQYQLIRDMGYEPLTRKWGLVENAISMCSRVRSS